MKKALIFGVGRNYEAYKKSIFSSYEIIGLADNSHSKQGTIVDNYTISDINDFSDDEMDVILVTPTDGKEMIELKLSILLDNFFSPIFKLKN